MERFHRVYFRRTVSSVGERLDLQLLLGTIASVDIHSHDTYLR